MQAHQISCRASDFVLRRHLEHRINNGDTEDEALQHCAKYMVSGAVYGTPSWYRRWYYDMRCMFNNVGIPTVFLTLTADEVSDTRFPEIDALEGTLRQVMPLDADYRWPWQVTAKRHARSLRCQGGMLAPHHNAHSLTACPAAAACHLSQLAPVENARIFHARVQVFLSKVLGDAAVIGRITNQLVRYEVQGRGSLHAHIMLWIHADDIPALDSMISGAVPGELRDGLAAAADLYDTSSWKTHCDHQAQTLLQMVLRKQIHRCTPRDQPGCCSKGACRYHFPASLHPQRAAAMGPTGRFRYFCPREPDRYVVPYIPILLLLWRGHLNVQRIVDSLLSGYLAYYVSKAEPEDLVQFNQESADLLGLTHLTEQQKKLVTGMVLARPVSATEAAAVLLGIPIMEATIKVEYIDTNPPDTQRRSIGRNGAATSTALPVEKYAARPDCMRHYTFMRYFKEIEPWGSKSMQPPAQRVLYGVKGGHLMDSLGNMLLWRASLVRFTDPNPRGSPEAWAYNFLLERVPFVVEASLLTADNPTASYMWECVNRGLLDAANLEAAIDEALQVTLHAGMLHVHALSSPV
jgi:hypothetical protein